jgi:hypothetical protein
MSLPDQRSGRATDDLVTDDLATDDVETDDVAPGRRSRLSPAGSRITSAMRGIHLT